MEKSYKTKNLKLHKTWEFRPSRTEKYQDIQSIINSTGEDDGKESAETTEHSQEFEYTPKFKRGSENLYNIAKN